MAVQPKETRAKETRMSDVLRQTETIVDALQKVRDEALHYGRSLTSNGTAIDEHQVHAERLAYLATEVEAAQALLSYAKAASQNGDTGVGDKALGFAAEVSHKLIAQVDVHLADFGFSEAFVAVPFSTRNILTLTRA